VTPVVETVLHEHNRETDDKEGHGHVAAHDPVTKNVLILVVRQPEWVDLE
jgi:hypothetical protein